MLLITSPGHIHQPLERQRILKYSEIWTTLKRYMYMYVYLHGCSTIVHEQYNTHMQYMLCTVGGDGPRKYQ